MPIRVRSKASQARDESPVSIRHDYHDYLPSIAYDDDFRSTVKKLSTYATLHPFRLALTDWSSYFRAVIELPSTFEQLRTTAVGNPLRALVDHLVNSCTNPAIVNSLL